MNNFRQKYLSNFLGSLQRSAGRLYDLVKICDFENSSPAGGASLRGWTALGTRPQTPLLGVLHSGFHLPHIFGHMGNTVCAVLGA